MTAEEVARAKTQLVAAAVYAQDSQQTMAQIFGEVLMSGRSIEDVVAWPDRIAQVTPERVAEAARHIFKPERSVTGTLMKAEKN